tara:strand:- start:9971 stop:10720 length:750 start_codon:yes stop_codon:yes gene_type:complete
MRSTRGNVLFLILIAIGLFAALSYAMTQPGRGGASIDQERASLLAGEIFRELAAMDQAVKRLQLIKKCSDTEISFAYDSDGDGDIDSNDDYYNPNAPTDFKCHMFHEDGGGLDWPKVPPLALDDAHSAETTYGQYFFVDLMRAKGIGTDCDNLACTDLLVNVAFLKQNVATELNRKLGIAPAEPQDDQACNLTYIESAKFKGSYSSGCGATSTYGDDNPSVAGRRTACVYRFDFGGRENYECHHALIAR